MRFPINRIILLCLYFLLCGNLEITECRAKPFTFPTNEDLLISEVKLQKRQVNFDNQEGATNFNRGPVEHGIYFQTDSEREEELHLRHQSVNSDKLVLSTPEVLDKLHKVAPSSPASLELETKDTESQTETGNNSLEALEEFLAWAAEKGVPQKVLASIQENKKRQRDRQDSQKVGDFSIVAGEDLPCADKGHVKSADGTCREVVSFF